MAPTIAIAQCRMEKPPVSVLSARSAVICSVRASTVGYDSPMRIRAGLAAIVLAALLSLSAVPAHEQEQWAPQIESIASPATGVSGQPQLSPSSRGGLFSWFGA